MSDHSRRTTKHFEPGLGECVCEYCTRLPWHGAASTDTRQAVDAARPLRLLTALQPYLRHDSYCRSEENEGSGPCTCGLQDARFAFGEAVASAVAAIRADERARIGAASQDETENRP